MARRRAIKLTTAQKNELIKTGKNLAAAKDAIIKAELLYKKAVKFQKPGGAQGLFSK